MRKETPAAQISKSALPVEDARAGAGTLRRSGRPSGPRSCEKRPRIRNKGNASPVKEEHDDVPAPPSEPPKDVVTRVVLWPEYALLRDGDVRVHVERHYREAPRGAQARRARPRWQLIAAAERARRRLSLRLDALRRYGPPGWGDARAQSRDRRSSHRVRCEIKVITSKCGSRGAAPSTNQFTISSDQGKNIKEHARSTTAAMHHAGADARGLRVFGPGGGPREVRCTGAHSTHQAHQTSGAKLRPWARRISSRDDGLAGIWACPYLP